MCEELVFSVIKQILETNMKEHSRGSQNKIWGNIKRSWYSGIGCNKENAKTSTTLQGKNVEKTGRK